MRFTILKKFKFKMIQLSIKYKYITQFKLTTIILIINIHINKMNDIFQKKLEKVNTTAY